MATIKNFPNNADEYIGAEYVMKWLHGRTSGVFGADGNLAVSANDDMTVSVSDGVGWIANADADGSVFWNDNEDTYGSKLTLSIGLANSSLPRIDRIVVSWDTVDYTAKPTIEVLQGTPASNPTVPALTNTTLKRQISLAQVRVNAGASKITSDNITDERLNSEVCGLVTAGVNVDTSVMQAQFEALLNLISAELGSLNAGTEAMLKTTYDPERRERNIFSDVAYLYKATFESGGWESDDSNYIQVADLTPVDGGPQVTESSTLLASVGIDSSLDDETREKMRSDASKIVDSRKRFLNNQIRVAIPVRKSAPKVDVELYYLIKQGESGTVPLLDPVAKAGSTIELLWTNSSPSATFPAKKVSLDLSGYDLVMVLGWSYQASAVCSSIIVPVGVKGVITLVGAGTAYRNFSTSSTGVTFEAASVENTATPYKIYGIKL